MGLAWVGPAIIEYGSDAQKRRFIPDILDGDYQWCTGYSEPGVGQRPRLAPVPRRARRRRLRRERPEDLDLDRDVVEVDDPAGAHRRRRRRRSTTASPACWCEMETPGITVRPISNMAGGAMFAEVFFDDVRVPVANRLGAEGEGWGVTVSALAHERSGIAEVHGPPAQPRGHQGRWRAAALRRGRPAQRGSGHPPAHRAHRTRASRRCA